MQKRYGCVILINIEIILGTEINLLKKVAIHYFEWLSKYKGGMTSTEDDECLRHCFWTLMEMYIRNLSLGTAHWRLLSLPQ
jgi:hypothetical protein